MAVQISGNDITVPRDGSFTRNVTIGGTLTYEDVTNIDSVGLVTARTGIKIGTGVGVAASISVDGNAEFSGITTIGGASKFGGNMQMTSANPEFEFNNGGPRFRSDTTFISPPNVEIPDTIIFPSTLILAATPGDAPTSIPFLAVTNQLSLYLLHLRMLEFHQSLRSE